MNPQEKAQELFDKYWALIAYKIEGSVGRLVIKQCAELAVDEILLIAPMMHMEGFGNLTIREYYKKVKQEIEKL